MIPQWVPGLAARDAMTPRTGGGSGSSKGDARGILSFIGIVFIAFATLARATDAHLRGAAWGLAAVSFCLSWWAAYKAKGWLKVPAGICVAGFAAYSLYFIQSGDGGGGWFWPIVVFVLVGADQFGVKS